MLPFKLNQKVYFTHCPVCHSNILQGDGACCPNCKTKLHVNLKVLLSWLLMNMGLFYMVSLIIKILTHYQEYGLLYLLGALLATLAFVVGILSLFTTAHLLKPAEQQTNETKQGLFTTQK